MKHQAEPGKDRVHRKGAENNQEENYEEEEDELVEHMAGQDKGTNRRAEM